MNIEQIFSLSAINLKDSLAVELNKYGYYAYNDKDFLYAKGDAPYMLVAHLDTVHKELPSIICYSKDGNHMMSPQGIGGDDRCGVYIILELLKRLPFKPHVVFTMDEEIGGLGADAFVDYMYGVDDIADFKYIVEYDRKGNKDCVFYQCENPEFTKFVESFGFVESHGTFSDISIIAPVLGAAAVNLSSGYYNPHTQHEYVCMSDMRDIIEKSVKMLCTESENFKYIECVKKYGNYYDSKYKSVLVSKIPAGKMAVYDKSQDTWFENLDNEIVMDQQGNLYQWSYLYYEYETADMDKIMSNDDDFVPEYDAANARTVWAYTK